MTVRWLMLLVLATACATHADNVCEDLGLCRAQTDDQITACQTEAKALAVEARSSGCGGQFDGYFSCADDHYVCKGNVPSFAGCESLRGSLDTCLAAARDKNSCGRLTTQLAGCPGQGSPTCGATELCTSRCYLDNVANVCTPQPLELDRVAHCVQQCP
jgi:hypothetical protein